MFLSPGRESDKFSDGGNPRIALVYPESAAVGESTTSSGPTWLLETKSCYVEIEAKIAAEYLVGKNGVVIAMWPHMTYVWRTYS